MCLASLAPRSAHSLTDKGGVLKDLVVDVPLENEHIRIDGPTNAYRPIGLEPLQTYEMRVSFVSTRAAQIHFGYDCQDDSPAGGRRRNRRILHAEKVMFSTDDEGRMRDHPGCLLTVGVTSWGRMRSETAGDFVYDVVMERNVLGIPVSGLPLIVYAVCAVVAVVAVVVAGAKRGGKDWLDWLDANAWMKTR